MTNAPDLATLALHADDGLEDTPDVAPPLHLATTFAAGNAAEMVYARNDTLHLIRWHLHNLGRLTRGKETHKRYKTYATTPSTLPLPKLLGSFAKRRASL